MQKQKLSFWQIWNMSFGFLGIQFGFALQNANVSRIFENLGASIESIPILWIAAPTTGLLVQPIVGYMSDRTWGRLGRRRPYFLVGAILASLALVIMPNSSHLWIAAGMLWILDASINISMEPFRALVADKLPSEQRTVGFAVQSFFIGTGAIVASSLPYVFTNWLGINNKAPVGKIPDSVVYSFYIGAIVFLVAVCWTVFTTKEYPPENIEEFKAKKEESKGILVGIKEIFLSLAQMPKTMLQLAFVQFFSWFALFAMWIYSTPGVTGHIYDMKMDANSITYLNSEFSKLDATEKAQYAEIGKELDLYQSKFQKGREKVAVSIHFVSFFLKQEEQGIRLDPNISHRLKTIQKEYNKGADWVGVLMSVYNGFAALMAFVIMWLAKKSSRKTVHSLSLILGGLGLASFYVISNPKFLLLSELGIGLAWASILAMPYAILAGALPPKKMGMYMGIFNFFIVIPQIVAAAILGWIVHQFFSNEAIYALLLGGGSLILAAFLVTLVYDVDEIVRTA